MILKNIPNLNYLWSTLIIEELIRNGGDYFCISPGSRSSPLTVAVAQNKKAKNFIHFDERGNAFHALGHSSATNKPCVIITTSGTAVANLFPAVIEASKKKLPLIILSADRPPELRFTGAHQTIDQVKIFGDYVRWSFDFPCPTLDIKPEFVLTTIDQAIHKAQGEFRGPVHINCMFREPLAPIRDQINLTTYKKSVTKWQNNKLPFTQYNKAKTALTKNDLTNVIKAIKNTSSGIIVVGKLSNDKERESVVKLAKKLQWPIFPDVTSGLRLNSKDEHVIHHFDQMLFSESLRKKIKVDTVIHLGGRITSKRWYEFIDEKSPNNYIMVLNHPLRNDPLHNVTHRIQSKIDDFCAVLEKNIPRKSLTQTLNLFQRVNNEVKKKIDQILQGSKKLTEAAIARRLTQLIPKNHGLFLSSSLPIRQVDIYGTTSGNTITIGSNRGASGIDGTVASASGFLNGINQQTTLLIGDLALLHDLNSLAMLEKLKKPMIIVVLNNKGGGIFSFLPIAKYKDIFEKYFLTPHNFSFDSIAQMFKINYKCPKSIDEFSNKYTNALKQKKSTLIEIVTDPQDNLKLQKQIQKAVN